MRVLLISPKYRTHIVAPHLGLGYLASALRRGGHEVAVLDGVREDVVYDPSRYDLVGLTAMTTYFPEMVAEVRRAKAYGLPTIIGGPHVIADPEGSLRQSGADYACAGEGELLLTALANGEAPEKIQGLCYWKDGAVVRNGSTPFYKALDEFGGPAWDLIDPRSYPPAPHGMIARRFPLAPIITTRGCPYSCTYCSAPITAGKAMRYRTPKQVVDEIEVLHREYGVREVQIEDDNFTIKREHAVAICEELIRRDLPVIWSLPNGVRIDRLDPELLRLMKRAGCYLMALGIESSSQRILDMVKKKLDVALVRRVVGWVNESGIEAWGFFMIGFPTETREEVEATVEFALSLPLDRVQFTKTTPLPGTDIYDYWREHYAGGAEIDWSTFNYYAFEANWAAVSAREIVRIQKRAHLRFYLRPRNMLRMLSRLRPAQYRFLMKRLANLGLFGALPRMRAAIASRRAA
ncbi:MAG: radical SAM protein [Candidatus Rokubacteria bacterium]|nr:radical SAM protein [Candidatus Rokubacteria bacterium]